MQFKFGSILWTCAISTSVLNTAHAQNPVSDSPSHPPIPIPFTLQEAGFVTLVIENTNGQRVRNLISETPFPVGQNTAWWDGLDDIGRDPRAYDRGVSTIPGKIVAPGKYQVRGLWRADLKLRYQLTPYNEAKLPWRTADSSSGGLTNHTPPRAILFVPPHTAPPRENQPTSQGAQILVGSSVSEGGSGLAWLDSNGKKLYGQEWLGGIWTGVQYLARNAGGNAPAGVYAYSAHAWDDELRLQELQSKPGAAAKDTRLGAGDDVPVLSPTWKFPTGTKLNDHTDERGVGGLAAFNGIIAVSLPVANQLLFVDGSSHSAIGTVPLENPGALAFDAQGRLLAFSGKKLLRYTLPEDLKAYVEPTSSAGSSALSKDGWKASASKTPETAQAAIDRSDATRYESRDSQHPGDSLTIDMARAQRFTSVELNTPWPPNWTHAYEIYATNDLQNWGAPLATGEGKPDRLTIPLPPTTARYVKIVQTGTVNTQWAINEITLFNEEVFNGPVNPPKPLPAPQVLIEKGLDEPQNLAISRNGNLYIADWGQHHNVQVFDGAGKYLRSIGKPGVPRAGAYDATKMHHPASVTLDDKNQLWVAEEDFQPKRVSVWNAVNGQFVRAFYGPQRYGGGGELDSKDQNIYYYDGMKFALDYANQTSEPKTIFYRPAPGEVTSGGDSVNDYMPQTPLYFGGQKFITNAYNSNPTNGASVSGLWQMMPNGAARPVALMGQANDYAYFRDLGEQKQNLSIRWTGVITAPQSGEYTLTTVSDDGVRLTIGDKLLIDNWTPHGTTEDKATIHLEAGQTLPIKLEYFQGSGGGTMRLLWQHDGSERALVPSDALRPTEKSTENGLRSEYFSGVNFDTLRAMRLDATIDFSDPVLPPVAGKVEFAARLPKGANPGVDGNDNSVFFLWQDRNADAKMQADEVNFQKLDTGRIESVTVMDDGAFIVFNFNGQTVRFAPQMKANVPRYDISAPQVLADGIQHPTSTGGGQALLGKDGWTVVYPSPKPFAPYGVAGVKKGRALWSYPSLWPGLHASHNSPKPQFPGEMIGTTRMLGNPITPNAQIGPLFALNGNMGNFYLMTTDGLFVATLFKDIRQSSTWNFPVANKELDVSDTSLHDESFWPFLTQTPDGIFASVNGSIVRVDGLDKMRRLPARTLEIDAPLLAEAQTYFVAREAERQARDAAQQKPLSVVITPNVPVVDGKIDDWKDAQWAVVDTKWVGGLGGWGGEQNSVEAAVKISGDHLFAAFVTDDANLLQNKPDALNTLFKSGGALDLMLNNVEGGQRLLISRANEKIIAVLYRPRDANANGEPVKFISSIGTTRTVTMARVQDVSAQITLAQDGNNYELSVPLDLLEWTPQVGQSVKADIGVLRGDGLQTTQRAYWHNKATGLTADLASEAELTPQLWGEWALVAP